MLLQDIKNIFSERILHLEELRSKCDKYLHVVKYKLREYIPEEDEDEESNYFESFYCSNYFEDFFPFGTVMLGPPINGETVTYVLQPNRSYSTYEFDEVKILRELNKTEVSDDLITKAFSEKLEEEISYYEMILNGSLLPPKTINVDYMDLVEYDDRYAILDLVEYKRITRKEACEYMNESDCEEDEEDEDDKEDKEDEE